MINNKNSYYANYLNNDSLNNQSEIFYKKYCKYKKKYLDLKQLIGGNEDKESGEKERKAIDVLIENPAVALYIRSFRKDHDQQSYCRALSNNLFEEIGKFDNSSIINGTEIELDKLKESYSNWESMTFGEIKRINRPQLEEYCSLYNNEHKSVLDDDANLFGEFDDTITKDRMEEAYAREDEQNNVTNLFSA